MDLFTDEQILAWVEEIKKLDEGIKNMTSQDKTNPQCCCGAHKVKDSRHAYWCDIKED